MRGASRFWLSGRNGWGATLPGGPTVEVEGLWLGRGALRLAARPGGPYDPMAQPASLGSLVAPSNVVVEPGHVLIASADDEKVRRIDRGAEEARDWLGFTGMFAPRPAGATAILSRVGALTVLAIRGGTSVVAIHSAGVIADSLDLPDGLRVWDIEPQGPRSVAVLADGPDRRGARVYCWRPGHPDLLRGPDVPRGLGAQAVVADRLVRDGEGRLYVFDSGTALVRPLSEPGTDWVGVEDVRSSFPLPGIAFEPDSHFGWRFRLAPDPAAEFAWPAPSSWPAFDPDGRRLSLPPEVPVGPPPYVSVGRVEIGPLDAGIERTVWDRLELALVDLPRGCAVDVQTRTGHETAAVPEPVWTDPQRYSREVRSGTPARVDFAVLDRPGRYAWIAVELRGGVCTPAVESIEVRFPRSGIVDYLPTVYRETDQDGRFLERLLGALEQTWQPIESTVDDFHRELRPEVAQSEEMLEYLASWFDQPVRPEWSLRSKRRAVRSVADNLKLRGTPAAVGAALRLQIANRWDLDLESLSGMPFIWEHFRSRQGTALPTGDSASDPDAGSATLFGADVHHRLQLGSSAVGQGVMRDRGSVAEDLLGQGAYHFSVFVPRSLSPTRDDVRRLQEILRAEAPAGAVGDVVLVEARMRVGRQATLGVDTILGVYPTARLAAGSEEGLETPPARLDYDALLASAEPGAATPTPEVGGDGAFLPWRLLDT